MRRRFGWSHIGALAGLALAIFLGVGIYRAGLNERPLPPVTQPMTLLNGSVTNHRITTKSWSFAYDSAHVSPDGSMATVQGVHDGIVYRDGKPYVKLSAQQMTLNRATLDFTASGRVHVTRLATSATQTFDTDLVVWSNATKMLRLDHPAYLTTNGRVLKVDHVTVDLKTNTMTIGEVDGTVDLEP